jgi:hypothetical protein
VPPQYPASTGYYIDSIYIRDLIRYRTKLYPGNPAIRTSGSYRPIQVFLTILSTIIHTTNRIKPAETTVVVIASHLGLSKIMPIMPNIKETGAENKMSNPPRTGTGLPQPGLSMHIVRITAPTTAIKTADSFPKSIFSPIIKTRL